ncbi:MAG: glycosyltransferase family 4 protein [Caldilineaceae bacterium]|nr:glycosyltransferase family 4 protein [Caldilineaceae bacterium]MCB9137175.1 glycosyltransferase family 4 protein [Caldilineaceae bacterium]
MYHQPAGISRYTWHLLNAMAAIEAPHQFTIYQHRKHRSPLIERPNFRRATLYAPVHTRLEQYMMPLELLPARLDLLHSPDFIPPLYSSIPTVITVHDLAFLHWPHFVTKDSAAYYGQIDRAVAHARHIIVPSEHTRSDLTAQMGVPPDKISVIYEAADPRFTPLPQEETRREVMKKFGLPERYVFFVGTIEPRKNLTGLLQAFKILIDRYNVQDVNLAVAGSRGWLYEEVLNAVETLDLTERVHLLDRVSDDDLHKLYVGARCHIHPAFYEGFGLPPLEAMACGTPTIVSNVSSLPEVVNDAALLVDPRDWEEIAIALYRLLTDDGLHAELRHMGLQRAKDFSWTMAAEQTLAVYENTVNRKEPISPAEQANEQTRTSSRAPTVAGQG